MGGVMQQCTPRPYLLNAFNFAEWASIVLVFDGVKYVLFCIKWFSIGFERALRTENIQEARILR